MEQSFSLIQHYLTTYGMSVIGAVIMLIVGRYAAKLGRKITEKLMTKADVDPSVRSFTCSLVYFLILTVTLVAVLAQFGVQTASLITIMGAAALSVGMALQGSLSNFAAGVLILVLRPYRVGDYIDAAGSAGTVKDIQLFTTILSTPDNVKILVPNGKIFSGTIKNISAYDTRRADVVVGIGYDSSIEKAVEIIDGLLREDSRVLDEPKPLIAVSELADSSVNLVVRPWVKSSDFWPFKFDFNKKVKLALDEAGIDIPYPQQVVHMVKEGGE